MPNNYVLLDRIELNNTAASVTFDNIPQSGYTDLKVVYSARGDAATTDRGLFVRLGNGSVDTGSNYIYRFLRGDGSAAGTGSATTSFLYFGNFNAGTSTANTFGNGEFYIPNYRSSAQKSVSSDSVSENNATSAWTTLAAGLWTGTSAINIMLLYPESGNFLAGSTFSLYGLAQVGTTPAIAPKADGGNVIGTDGTYWYHAFLSNGTFRPQVGLTCDILAVGGGGSAGYDWAGGGGAGGVQYLSGTALAVNSYTVTIGAGGVGAVGPGSNGIDSSFASTVIAKGGGFGGSANQNGGNGGSGGGGNQLTNQTGGTAVAGTGGTFYGNAGGNGYRGGAAQEASGGGGGAAAAGGSGNSSLNGGAGGIGTSLFSSWGAATGTGQNVSGTRYYAGGGGGAGRNSHGAGGLGGGGNGGTAATGASGLPNTGGGGGGDTFSGGSGIVIVRYLVA